ncbi:MAG: hypothetical protein HOV70_03815 [Streptomyces sp.]|nr:hypothetical protein [Streptomyces sp.]
MNSPHAHEMRFDGALDVAVLATAVTGPAGTGTSLPPGAGKTRLLDEVAARDAAAGFTVARTRSGQALSGNRGIRQTFPTVRLLDAPREAPGHSFAPADLLALPDAARTMLAFAAVTARILVWDADPGTGGTGRYRLPELPRDAVLSNQTASARRPRAAGPMAPDLSPQVTATGITPHSPHLRSPL